MNRWKTKTKKFKLRNTPINSNYNNKNNRLWKKEIFLKEK